MATASTSTVQGLSPRPAGDDYNIFHTIWGPHAWFSLSFADEELERAFGEHNKGLLAEWDARFCLLNFGFLLAFLVLLEFGWLASTYPGRFWTRLVTSIVGIQFLVACCCKRSFLIRHRTPYILGFRLLFMLTAPFYVREFYPITVGVSSLLADIFITSCGPMGFWQGLGMPVLYKHHVFVQLFTIATFGFVVNAGICQRLSSHQAAIDATNQVFGFLDATFTIVTEIYLPFYQQKAPYSGSKCFPIVTTMQFLIGYIGPTCMLYRMECNSRMAFLRQVTSNRQSPSAPLAGLIPNWVGFLLGFSLVMFSCTAVWSFTANSSLAWVASGM